MKKDDTLRMKIAIILGMFFIGCIYGFVYETIFYLINDGWLVHRGTCFGPFIQIYGYGGLMIYFLCSKLKLKDKPIIIFLISGISSGILEYAVGWYIFTFCDGLRAWDYNTEIWNWGNIDGYVCLRSVLVFAISGVVLICLIEPILLWLRKKIGDKAFFWLMMIPGAICAADVFYNDVLCRIFPLQNAITFWHYHGWESKESLVQFKK